LKKLEETQKKKVEKWKKQVEKKKKKLKSRKLFDFLRTVSPEKAKK